MANSAGMSRPRPGFWLLSLAILTSGCTTLNLNPEGRQSAINVPDKLPLRAAVVMPEEETAKIYTQSFFDGVKSVHTRSALGQTLQDTLTLSLGQVFDGVSVVQARPAKSAGYDIVLSPTITGSRWDYSAHLAGAEARFILNGTLTAEDPGGANLAVVTKEGRGSSFLGAGIGAPGFETVVSKAVGDLVKKWGEELAAAPALRRYALKSGRPVGRAAPQPQAAPVASDVDVPRHRAKENADDVALVVGVENYSSEMPEAEFAERDAQAVKAHLMALGLPERNIKFLLGSQATRGRLEGALEDWLPRMAKPGGRVFFYFSGHGAPDPESRQAFLVPWDGEPGLLSKTALPLKQVYQDLNALKAKQVVVVLDSCFSGAGGRSVLARGIRPLVTQIDASPARGGKILLFAASGGAEITGTLKDQGHGIFTYYFLKGLDGEAQDASGAVTPRGLYDYLKPKVQDAASGQSREQTPVLEGAETAETLVRIR